MIYIIFIAITLIYLFRQVNIINLSYNLLYFVSLAQIKYNKIKKYLTNSSIGDNNDDNNYLSIEYYNNGKLCLIENTQKHLVNLYKCNYNNYDYVIVSDKTHKIIFSKKYISNFEYDLSNIKFLSLNLNYNNNIYNINLKDEHHNFYIVNNEINKDFIQYYLENKLGVKSNNNNFTYQLEIIDHNVNFINLTEQDTLILLKEDYIINK